MELYDEDEMKKGKNGKKIVIASLAFSIMLLLALVLIVLTIPRNPQIKENLYVAKDYVIETDESGKSVDKSFKNLTIPNGLFYIADDKEKYISLSDFASIIGYEYYRGEYADKYTETGDKCYVQNKYEATSFILGTNIVYKTDQNNTLKYEYYTLKKPVIKINDKLYASIDAINIAFNSKYSIDDEKRQTIIEGLPYLYGTYEEYYNKQGYSLSYTTIQKTEREEEEEVKVEQSFQNQKALVYNMAVINRNNKFGVVNTSNNSIIIGTKYDKIEYLEERQEFIVESDKKIGVLSNKGETIINIEYDGIALLDAKDNYYLVSKNSKYGIIKSDEETVVPIGFDRIYYRLINNKKSYYLQVGNNIITLEDYLSQR